MKRAIGIISVCLVSIMMLSGCKAILDRIIPPTESEPAESAFIEATTTAEDPTATPTTEPTPTTAPDIEPTTEPVEEVVEEATVVPEATAPPRQINVKEVDQAIVGFTCSPNLAEASDLAIAASWEAGDSRLLEVAKRHTQTLDGNVQVIESVTEVLLTVLEVVDDGYIIEWSFGETNIDLPPSTVDVAIGNGILQQLGPVLEGIRVEYETDRLGIYRGIRNAEELADAQEKITADIAAEVAAQFPDADSVAVATELVGNFMSTPQQMEVAFAQDIQHYHALFGSTLDSENPVLFASLVPTFFSSDVIPSLSEIYLAGYDADSGCAVAQMQGKVDGERAKQTIRENYVASLEANGLTPSTVGSETATALEEESQYHIDVTNGWLLSLDHQRTVIVGDTEISEKTFIIDKTRGPSAEVATIEPRNEAPAEVVDEAAVSVAITESGTSSTTVAVTTVPTITVPTVSVPTSTVPTSTVPVVTVPVVEPEPTNPFPNAFVGIANANANLRDGPSTENARIGRAAQGDILFVVDKNSAEDWYLLDDDSWIAAFLVDRAPDDVAATTTPPFPIVGTANEPSPSNTGAVAVVSVPTIDADISISGTASITGTGAISATGVFTPTPQPQTERGNPLLTEEEKDNAVKAILQIPLIQDAVIVQDELSLSLIIGMKNEADAETAQQVGDNFVRLVKAYSNVEPNPDQSIGEGVYDYYIYVVTPAGNDAAIGRKERSEADVSW